MSFDSEAEEAFKILVAALDVNIDKAGLLENGESLAHFIQPATSLEPSAGDGAGKALFEDAGEDISLGILVPTDDQILIAQVQEQLRKVRLYNGPQAGIVGAGTIKAIQSYQRQQGLPIDGEISQQLLTYMLYQGTI